MKNTDIVDATLAVIITIFIGCLLSGTLMNMMRLDGWLSFSIQCVFSILVFLLARKLFSLIWDKE